MKLKRSIYNLSLCVNKLFLFVFLSVIYTGFSQVSSVVLNGDFEEGTDNWQLDPSWEVTINPFHVVSFNGSYLSYDGSDNSQRTKAAWFSPGESSGDNFGFTTRYAYQPLQLIPGEDYVFEFEYAIERDVATDPTGDRKIIGTIIDGHYTDIDDIIDINNGGAIKSDLEITSLVGSEVYGISNFKRDLVRFTASATGEVAIVFHVITSVHVYLDNVKVYPYILNNDNFKDAVDDCLAANPVDGLCVGHEFGPMPDWDVSGVTDMGSMFYENETFNADISNWDVSNVTNMFGMFHEAYAFDQDLSSWNLESIDDPYRTLGMFSFSGMSMSNYDKTISGWRNNVSTPDGLIVGANDLVYCSSSLDREYLENSKGWDFYGDYQCTSDTDFVDFYVEYQTEEAEIDTVNHVINVNVYNAIDVTSLQCYFTLPRGASATVGSVIQESGVTLNDYTNPVTYNVIAEDGTVQSWVVNIIKVNGSCNSDFPYTEDFEGVLGEGWMQSRSDDQDLTIQTGGTPSNSGETGPAKAESNEYYIYAEASSNINTEFELVSKCFDFSSIKDPIFMFLYHMYGSGAGTLDVDVSTDYRQTWTSVWSLSGNQGNQWKEAVIDLKPYAGLSSVFFRFKIVTGNTFRSDTAIDNIRINGSTAYTSKEILSYSVLGEFDHAVIDDVNKTINVEFLESLDLTSLKPSFVLSEGASVQVNGVYQTSGVTDNDFTDDLTYTVIAADGSRQDWLITKAIKQDSSLYDFVTTWKTDNYGETTDTQIKIPTLLGELYNYEVDWNNDGVFDEHNITGDVMHDYGVSGTYTIRIRGLFPRIYFNRSGDFSKIVSIDQWGANLWTSMRKAFLGCNSLNGTASDIPNLSNLTNTSYMFTRASVFNQDVGEWDMSNVVNISWMFDDAFAFNQDIGNWDTSNVVNMRGLFSDASSFNQDISSWNVSNVLNAGAMFSRASSFNQNLGDWNMSSVTDMKGMLSASGMSVENYDATLSGWSNNENIPDNIELGAHELIYCNAESDRSYLIEEKGWVMEEDVLDCTGVETLSSEDLTNNKMQVYPNPVVDVLNIVFPDFSNELVRIEVFNMFGKRVLFEEKEITNKEHQLSLENLNAGVYLIKINYKGFQFIKILKE